MNGSGALIRSYSTERVLKSITYKMTDNDTWS